MSTKFGSSVMIPGTMSAVRNSENTMFRPGQRSRAKAYAASTEEKTTQMVSEPA